jgi:hypothetical protein
MSKTIYYRQCRYERVKADGSKGWDETWIPEHLAKVGKKIYFGEKGNPGPDDMYTVITVGTTRRTGPQLRDEQNINKNQWGSIR